eukprot:GHVT01049882.1.p1 GENE.GHVT01049882.1~~GHVT01049882.1.p1  ORF type:complete len:119 (+),score=15.58 GHVT01049882.1:1180-1536(+)
MPGAAAPLQRVGGERREAQRTNCSLARHAAWLTQFNKPSTPGVDRGGHSTQYNYYYHYYRYYYYLLGSAEKADQPNSGKQETHQRPRCVCCPGGESSRRSGNGWVAASGRQETPRNLR